jgi:hypothetical protein
VDVSDDLDRLLARGRLSGPQRDRVLEKVLAKTSRPRGLRLKHVALAAPLAAVAAVLILVGVRQREHADFSVKGGGGSVVEASCSNGPLSACPVGSTLVFRFDGLSAPAYVQAYATPSSPSEGERVWYFPTSSVPAPQLAAEASSELLQKAVVIGAEHSARDYRITIVLSAQPLTRDELLRQQGTHVFQREILQLGVVQP